MSRIGKQPIVIPPKAKVTIEGRKVLVEGPKGKLQMEIHRRTKAAVESGKVVVSRQGEDAEAKALHGLTRSLINNMVKGVVDGFVKKLEINGVGFKAAVQGKALNLSLGYSHPINYAIPDQIKVTVDENTKLTIEGPGRRTGRFRDPELLSSGTVQGQRRQVLGRTHHPEGRQDGTITLQRVAA